MNCSKKLEKSIENLKRMRVKMKIHNNKNIDHRYLRKFIKGSKIFLKKSKGVQFSSDTFGQIEVELARPGTIFGKDIILYIHGGIYCSGSANTSRTYASMLASENHLRVYTLSYRLAPEHPFPAGFNDCFRVYKEILKKYPQQKISIIGESAGGNLAIAVTLQCLKEGIKPPSSVVAFSPPTDLTGSLSSRLRNAKTDIILGSDLDYRLKNLYFPHHEASTPLISPLCSDLWGFPPLMIVVSRNEVLYDDGKLFAEKAHAAGVEVEFYAYNAFHAFPIVGRKVPEASEVMDHTVRFILRHFYCSHSDVESY